MLNYGTTEGHSALGPFARHPHVSGALLVLLTSQSLCDVELRGHRTTGPSDKGCRTDGRTEMKGEAGKGWGCLIGKGMSGGDACD